MKKLIALALTIFVLAGWSYAWDVSITETEYTCRCGGKWGCSESTSVNGTVTTNESYTENNEADARTACIKDLQWQLFGLCKGHGDLILDADPTCTSRVVTHGLWKCERWCHKFESEYLRADGATKDHAKKRLLDRCNELGGRLSYHGDECERE